MSWSDAIEDLTVDLAFWYDGTDDPDLPLPELARSVRELGTKFRALAVMQLLAEGNHNIFLHNLARSGRLRLFYLKRKAAESSMPRTGGYERSASRGSPFCASHHTAASSPPTNMTTAPRSHANP